MHRGRARGFTLVEMLLVMAVIVVLLALIVPSTISLLRGSQVGQGGEVVVSQLELARQTALARNRSVQVRVCRPVNGQFTGMMPLFAAPATNTDGSVKMSASGTVTTVYTQVGKPVSLPNAVIIDAGSKLSTLLNPNGVTPTSATSADPVWGSLGTNYQYVAFQFRPDGSTDLATSTSTPWFLTVHNATDGDALDTPPTNYCTIQIDPYNGHIQEFRP